MEYTQEEECGEGGREGGRSLTASVKKGGSSGATPPPPT